MKLFTEIANESRDEFLNLSLEDFDKFMDVVKKCKGLSKEYVTIVQDCYAIALLNGKLFDEKLVNGSSRDAAWMAVNYGGPESTYIEINRLVKKLSKTELHGLPYYMSENDLHAVLVGDKTLEDITLDLETERGRDRVARQNAGLVTAIASKYKGAGLDWNALISAGYLGLTKAMNDYHKSDEYVDVEQGLDNDAKKEVKKHKAMSFKQYASWRIRFQILNDLSDLSRTVKIGQYQYEKNKANGDSKANFNIVSVDQTLDDEGSTLVDRMAAFSNDNDAFRDTATNKKWEQVYKMIDDRFSVRTASMFYKCFGLHGYKKMKQVDIAKEYNITGAAVNMSCKDVIKFLKSNKKTMELLQDLMAVYSESLIANNTPETIMDAMISDDLFIMLQESTRWLDCNEFNGAVARALETIDEGAQEHIMACLENDLNFIDEHYDEYRRDIMAFLESVYPTECIRRKSDVEVISLINELNENHHTHNLSE